MKKNLTAKPVKMICSVNGCGNRSSYNLTRTRFHGSVLICEDCLQEALKTIKTRNKPKTKKQEKRVDNSPQDNINTDDGTETDDKEDEENQVDTTDGKPKFVCSKCGRECASRIGLTSHEKACKGVTI